jgi:ribosomal protein S27AE
MARGCLRGCPRCGGDVFAEHDPYVGLLLSCLQCGHTLTDAEERALRAATRNVHAA